ncbi:MAG: Cell division transporter, ATP-binding protein FtsE [Brockia lithotrophica]|uniref:Cell division transporter, ATP-binding protein FtsE n=1 Tax=Brockia lithotrophica TaxID=933949 RepID=A0A2T5G5P7_9BACL|nr:ABC transporter ATP-binding protein [Brockia lithotrophica]PTQ51493.1 MAG: Cell division transporter, ATP-binding protein FtsE [Brockia lithotrophica]
MTPPLIRLERVSKEYSMGEERVRALDEVNLEVDRGDFVAVVGPSGSGKSTLMHILGCLDRPTSGRYELDGREVGHLSEAELARIRNEKIGFVFQQFYLLPRLTAVENVELPLVYRGWPPRQRRERAKEVLVSLGLEGRLYHFPNQLSGGQQQRVAIARALVGDPELVLADEPTGALDSRTGKEILEIFAALHEEGRTIVLITHDMEVARRARRRIAIRDGRIVADEERGE